MTIVLIGHGDRLMGKDDARIVLLDERVVPPRHLAGVNESKGVARQDECDGGVECVEAVDGDDGRTKDGQCGGVGILGCLLCAVSGTDVIEKSGVLSKQRLSVICACAKWQADGEVGLGLGVEVNDEGEAMKNLERNIS